MKYVLAAVAAVFVFVAAQPAEAKRAKVVPYAKLTAWGQFERSLQCSARSNDQKIALNKRAAFVDRCKAGRA